uniref:Uncharacterized protein n=1 Tax=Romanomermis culicivorax TaxID=13658 RepID=A0A915IJN9_ROMCU
MMKPPPTLPVTKPIRKQTPKAAPTKAPIHIGFHRQVVGTHGQKNYGREKGPITVEDDADQKRHHSPQNVANTADKQANRDAQILIAQSPKRQPRNIQDSKKAADAVPTGEKSVNCVFNDSTKLLATA